MTEKKFYIVKIVDEYTVVINYGAIDGASIGEELDIFVEGPEIRDPITNESLNTLDLVKGKIEIITVYEKMSVCESPVVIEKESIMGIPSMLFRERQTQKKLNVNIEDISGGFPESGYKIQIGDLVRISKG